MTELVQCSRCKSILIDEEYYKHDCTPKLRNVKTFSYDSYYTMKDNSGNDIIVIKTMNGDLFSFEKYDKPRAKIPYDLIKSED